MSLTGNSFKNTHNLENFVGMSYDELKSSNQYDYEFIMETEKTDESEAGKVIRQTPEAGTKILEGGQVKLVVAITADDITVPNVYNLEIDMAKRLLNRRV